MCREYLTKRMGYCVVCLLTNNLCYNAEQKIKGVNV